MDNPKARWMETLLLSREIKLLQQQDTYNKNAKVEMCKDYNWFYR